MRQAGTVACPEQPGTAAVGAAAVYSSLLPSDAPADTQVALHIYEQPPRQASPYLQAAGGVVFNDPTLSAYPQPVSNYPTNPAYPTAAVPTTTYPTPATVPTAANPYPPAAATTPVATTPLVTTPAIRPTPAPTPARCVPAERLGRPCLSPGMQPWPILKRACRAEHD